MASEKVEQNWAKRTTVCYENKGGPVEEENWEEIRKKCGWISAGWNSTSD